MRKKSLVLLFAVCLLCAGAFISIGVQQIAAATSVRSFTLFKSVNLLGLSLLRSDSTNFELIDMSTSTANYVVTLPSVTSNNGMVYVVKRVGTNEYSLAVNAQSGEKIDGVENVDWALVNNGDAAIFVADDVNDTWWSISNSQGQL